MASRIEKVITTFIACLVILGALILFNNQVASADAIFKVDFNGNTLAWIFDFIAIVILIFAVVSIIKNIGDEYGYIYKFIALAALFLHFAIYFTQIVDSINQFSLRVPMKITLACVLSYIGVISSIVFIFVKEGKQITITIAAIILTIILSLLIFEGDNAATKLIPLILFATFPVTIFIKYIVSYVKYLYEEVKDYIYKKTVIPPKITKTKAIVTSVEKKIKKTKEIAVPEEKKITDEDYQKAVKSYISNQITLEELLEIQKQYFKKSKIIVK